MELGERFELLGRIALMLFILTSAAFLSALTAVRIAIHGREVVMPDVVGKQIPEAQALVQARGLGLRVEDRLYSSLPVDTVVRQSPPASTRVKVGQFAHVVLSLGPMQTAIPNLIQQGERAARIAVLRSGMQMGEITNVYLPGYPPDNVVEQDPAPGATGASSPHIDVLVSLGPRPPAYVMPGLDGLTLAEAQARLAGSGLKISKYTYAPLSGVAHGVVTGQTPAPGSRADNTTPIELQVAE